MAQWAITCRRSIKAKSWKRLYASEERVWKGRRDVTKKSDKNMIIGLDIGTSKVVAIVGEVNPEGEIEIIGLGSHPSRGLK